MFLRLSAGFGWSHQRSEWLVGIPLWLIGGLALVGGWLGRRKLRRAAQTGLCPTCGYDLRASPLRCPECGTPVTAAPVV